MPRVSIAIPTYNCERYIAQSVESLLGQTYGDFELVISDNASTDGTEQVCRKYVRLDARVRYVRRTDNIGGPGNFRYVYSLCSGEYHKWSTADDYWDSTFLAKAVALLDSRPDNVLCYPKTRLINAQGSTLEDYEDNLDLQEESPRDRFLRLMHTIGLCNAHLGLIRREAMNRTRLIGPELASDVHFLAELALMGKFALLPEQLFFRRFHEQSSSWNRDNVEHQRKYYNPGSKRSSVFHTWKKHRRLISSVWRAPIGIQQKLRLSRDLARFLVWDGGQLTRELAAAARVLS
jgi:glycosyltransferase involved in cell wall biosynthesis